MSHGLSLFVDDRPLGKPQMAATKNTAGLLYRKFGIGADTTEVRLDSALDTDDAWGPTHAAGIKWSDV